MYYYPEIAKQWHSTKNSITPDTIHCRSDIKVWWQCSTDNIHEWETSPKSRVHGKTGCPKCSRKTAKKILKWLITKY